MTPLDAPRRTLFVSDVHGHPDALARALALADLRATDRLAFVGDLVDRGPDSLGALRLVRDLLDRHPGSLAVCGNHEEAALRRRDRGRPPPAEDPAGGWAARATDDDWAFLAALPLFARLPDLGGHDASAPGAGVLVVHGGLYPGFFADEGPLGDPGPGWRTGRAKRAERLRRCLRVSLVGPDGRFTSHGDDVPGAVPWWTAYDGREGFVVAGHTPLLDPPAPVLAPHALALDTGCGFGGRLTVWIAEPGQPVARGRAVSVPERA